MEPAADTGTRVEGDTDNDVATRERLLIVTDESLSIVFSRVPSHWRANKALPEDFRVVALDGDVEDGTTVIMAAGSDENPMAELRNYVTQMTSSLGRFNDLRFVGCSGRGKQFTLTLTVLSCPPQVIVHPNAVKISVDGPRVTRSKRIDRTQPFRSGYCCCGRFGEFGHCWRSPEIKRTQRLTWDQGPHMGLHHAGHSGHSGASHPMGEVSFPGGLMDFRFSNITASSSHSHADPEMPNSKHPDGLENSVLVSSGFPVDIRRHSNPSLPLTNGDVQLGKDLRQGSTPFAIPTPRYPPGFAPSRAATQPLFNSKILRDPEPNLFESPVCFCGLRELRDHLGSNSHLGLATTRSLSTREFLHTLSVGTTTGGVPDAGLGVSATIGGVHGSAKNFQDSGVISPSAFRFPGNRSRAKMMMMMMMPSGAHRLPITSGYAGSQRLAPPNNRFCDSLERSVTCVTSPVASIPYGQLEDTKLNYRRRRPELKRKNVFVTMTPTRRHKDFDLSQVWRPY